MEDEVIWVAERTSNGYRIRQTTRSKEAVRDWAAIAVVVIGAIVVFLLTGGLL